MKLDVFGYQSNMSNESEGRVKVKAETVGREVTSVCLMPGSAQLNAFNRTYPFLPM